MAFAQHMASEFNEKCKPNAVRADLEDLGGYTFAQIQMCTFQAPGATKKCGEFEPRKDGVCADHYSKKLRTTTSVLKQDAAEPEGDDDA
jgi:hypothetical protein